MFQVDAKFGAFESRVRKEAFITLDEVIARNAATKAGKAGGEVGVPMAEAREVTAAPQAHMYRDESRL